MGSLPLFCLRVPIPTAMGKTGTTHLRLPQTTESPPPGWGNSGCGFDGSTGLAWVWGL